MINNRLYGYLGLLQLIIAIGALVGGFGLVFDPSGAATGFDLALLRDAPFADFFIPGLYLLVINGLGQLVSAIYSFRRKRIAGKLAIAFGLLLLGWMIAQIWWVGFFHLLQPLFIFMALVEVVMGSSLRVEISPSSPWDKQKKSIKPDYKHEFER